MLKGLLKFHKNMKERKKLLQQMSLQIWRILVIQSNAVRTKVVTLDADRTKLHQ